MLSVGRGADLLSAERRIAARGIPRSDQTASFPAVAQELSANVHVGPHPRPGVGEGIAGHRSGKVPEAPSKTARQLPCREIFERYRDVTPFDM